MPTHARRTNNHHRFDSLIQNAPSAGSGRTSTLVRAEEQDGDFHQVADAIRGGTQQQIR